MAGFECSSHRRSDGRRLDLLEGSRHAAQAEQDYRLVGRLGLRTARDGVRWHLIEARPGHYDWSSLLPMLRAARAAGTQVIWDLCHYGWPDDIDIWQPEFVARFARFARAVAQLLKDEGVETPIVCPINEISFWAWCGGEVGHINPCATYSGGALKQQLVRACIAAIEALREVNPATRILHAEPAIHVVAGESEHHDWAETLRLAQWEAWDMLAGRVQPELGGKPDYLDVLGVNYYPDNQWFLGGQTIPLGHHDYRPFSAILAEVYARYGRPLVVAETGAEGSARPAWLHYVADEVRTALDGAVPVQGICLYPVLEYPGWDDDRPCSVGLLSLAGRAVYQPLAAELRRLAAGSWPSRAAVPVAQSA